MCQKVGEDGFDILRKSKGDHGWITAHNDKKSNNKWCWTFCGKDYLFLLYGCAFLAYGLYDIIGYKCKWRHIYCSYQNANRRKMTPNHIHWDEVKKSDIYAMAAVMGVLGIAFIIASFYL